MSTQAEGAGTGGQVGRLLLVFAHPDDEAFFTAGTTARHKAAGGETWLVCGTRGERGSQPPTPVCQASELGRVRAAELADACQTMGASRLVFMGYEDKLLQGADFGEAKAKITTVMREFDPGAVVTFAADGIYGHPDHVAIHYLATAAFDEVFGRQAGSGKAPGAARAGGDGRRLWYAAMSSAFWRYRESVWTLGGRDQDVAGARDPGQTPRAGVSAAAPDDTAGPERSRLPVVEGLPEAAIDIRPFIETKLETLLCHRTQRHNVERAFGSLYDFTARRLTDPEAAELVGREYFTLARGPRPRYILEDSLLEPGQ